MWIKLIKWEQKLNAKFIVKNAWFINVVTLVLWAKNSIERIKIISQIESEVWVYLRILT